MNCVVCGKPVGWDNYCEECGFVAPAAECFVNKESLTLWCKRLADNRKRVLSQKGVVDKSAANSVPLNAQPNNVYNSTMIRKSVICPVCGTKNDGLTSYCLNCGYNNIGEISEDSFTSFKNTIRKYDSLNNRKETGWNSWNLIAKIGWVYINLCTYGTPALIYYVRRSCFFADKPVFSDIDLMKKSLIVDYAFQPSSLTLVDALSFFYHEINKLTMIKMTSYTLAWLDIWYLKAEELISKSEIVLGKKNDSLIQFKKLIKSDYKKAKSEKYNKRLWGDIILLGVLSFWVFLIVTVFYTYSKYK
ncbi:MAG: hypothetical protein IJ869_07365 [Clostridiales bacterium]|nr:hypothetical protein [Clostridiales bacterium]